MIVTSIAKQIPCRWLVLIGIFVSIHTGCALSTLQIPERLSLKAIETTPSNRLDSVVHSAELQPETETTFETESVAMDVFPIDVSVLDRLISDQQHFYSQENFRPFLMTLGTSAILANTTMDQEFADWYQEDVRSNSLDEIAEVAKGFGEQWPMVGAYLGASAIGRMVGEDTRLATWGDRSFRSMLVGVPPLLLLQKALGSSRPNDIPPSSDWNFWNDNNGASGHTFVGAVPFLVAAQMADNPGPRTAWYVLSTLPGWSRINDNDHYLSQVVVGWWLAYAATRSIEGSDTDLNYQIAPVFIDGAPGIGFGWKR